MIWAPYFERNTIISNTCVVRYAYICADVAIIGDYCYARCPPCVPGSPPLSLLATVLQHVVLARRPRARVRARPLAAGRKSIVLCFRASARGRVGGPESIWVSAAERCCGYGLGCSARVRPASIFRRGIAFDRCSACGLLCRAAAGSEPSHLSDTRRTSLQRGGRHSRPRSGRWSRPPARHRCASQASGLSAF